MKTTKSFPTLLQAFFTDRLIQQRHASPNTVASYRDSFRLLLRFMEKRRRIEPSKLSLENLDESTISDFLDYAEKERGNSAQTRNTRLAAIRSFFKYVALSEPTFADLCRRILAIPNKRFKRKPIEFLTSEEIDALLKAPDTATWIGRRDRALMMVGIQTGLRVTELIELRCEDIVLGTGAHVRCVGKGRKQRCTPLGQKTATILKSWLREKGGEAGDPVFPSMRGGHLSRDAVERLVARHLARAKNECPSLNHRRLTPHGLRHTAAMRLLHHGVDRSVIALWLGHESMETTQMYLHADMQLKEKALSHVPPFLEKVKRYRPPDRILEFLESL